VLMFTVVQNFVLPAVGTLRLRVLLGDLGTLVLSVAVLHARNLFLIDV
jgi:hypothetical protein